MSVNINKIIENERSKYGNIVRAFWFITFYLIITNFTIFSFYVITPIFFSEKKKNELTTISVTSSIYAITLSAYFFIYIINLIFISNKISSVDYIIILSFSSIIIYIW